MKLILNKIPVKMFSTRCYFSPVKKTSSRILTITTTLISFASISSYSYNSENKKDKDEDKDISKKLQDVIQSLKNGEDLGKTLFQSISLLKNTIDTVDKTTKFGNDYVAKYLHDVFKDSVPGIICIYRFIYYRWH